MVVKRNIKRLNLLLLFVIIINLPLICSINAEVQTLGTYKINEIVTLQQICDNCTYVNISSVLYPNSTVAVSNVQMTKQDTYYSYNFNFTGETGKYIVNTFGNLDGVKTADSYDFYITKTGTDLTIQESIIYIIVVFGILLVLFASLYLSIVTPYKNKTNSKGQIIQIVKLKYLKIFCITISYTLLTWFFNIMIALSDNYATLSLYYGFFEMMFNIFINLSLPFFILMIILSGYEIIMDFKYKEMMKNLWGIKI